MKARVGVLGVLAAFASLFAQQTPPPAAATRAAVSTNAADTLPPPVNVASTFDAESRAALFDLMNDRTLSALLRLQQLLAAPAQTGATADAARARTDATFLLAEAQYRLAMDSAFQATSAALLASAPSARYAPLLQSQQLLTAYRNGDFARVTQLAAAIREDRTQGLASLASGLAAYQLRQYPQARAAFAATIAAGPRFAPYARYMDILAQLRTDTAATANAITALQSLASSLKGSLADQVALTAAQLAYQSGKYEDAASIAGRIGMHSDVAPEALLTKAWAQYKAGRVADAGQSFAAFADSFPQLPSRDESRLMAAQSMLQVGSSVDAERLFRMVADSSAAEAQQLQAGTATLSAAARALVATRLAQLLNVADPTTGKTVALRDIGGAGGPILAAALSPDSTPPLPDVGVDRLISYTALVTQLASVKDSLSGVPRRVLFVPASTGGGSARYGMLADALYAADAGVALAKHELDEQRAFTAQRVAMLKGVQDALAKRRTAFDSLTAGMRAAQEKAAQAMPQLDTETGRIRAIILNDAQLVQSSARANLAQIEAERARGTDATTLAFEADAARQYAATAAFIASKVDQTIGRNVIFGLRDSLRTHSDSVKKLLDSAQTTLVTAQAAVAADLATLQRVDSSGDPRLRATLAAAEARRNMLQQQLQAAVETELRARSAEVLAQLQRDREAATFGVASASFFQAIDQGQAPGAGRTGTSTTGTIGPTSPTAAKTNAPPASAGTPPSVDKK